MTVVCTAGDCGVHCSRETGVMNNVVCLYSAHSCPGRHHSSVWLIVALLHADISHAQRY